LQDLRSVGCDVLTIGQYLQPTTAHVPVARYYDPAEFARLKSEALAMGFAHAESSPLTRSSYHAAQHVQG
jgi:lipoic acid synthetase